MRVAVINDIHANYHALSAVSEMLQPGEIDTLVVLGDLLTYGVAVQPTLKLMEKLNQRYDCHFIKGNHDQIYFDLQAGKDYRYKPFPEFIEESVQHTASQLKRPLIEQFDWRDSLVFCDVLFAHANAFGYMNWSYVNHQADFEANLYAIESTPYRGAIFGHTHRAKYCKKRAGAPASIADKMSGPLIVKPEDSFVMTNGSLGQPRGENASFLILDIRPDHYLFESVDVNYDLDAHCRDISTSSLSEASKSKLLSYYSQV